MMAILGKIKTAKVKGAHCEQCDRLVAEITLSFKPEAGWKFDGMKVCRACLTKEACDMCDNMIEEKELIEDREGNFCCSDCYQNTCGFCGNDIEKDGSYCSKECSKADNNEKV
tara:strand:- start:1995 stop:2333 length:339 start_codon:yes stop_codon:yes gene_type:complete